MRPGSCRNRNTQGSLDWSSRQRINHVKTIPCHYSMLVRGSSHISVLCTDRYTPLCKPPTCLLLEAGNAWRLEMPWRLDIVGVRCRVRKLIELAAPHQYVVRRADNRRARPCTSVMTGGTDEHRPPCPSKSVHFGVPH